LPPITDAGEIVNPARVAGLIVRATVFVVVASVAEMLAVTVAETPVVETVNVAEVAPAGTVTEAGTVALALSDWRLTVIPPVGAAPLSVTVPTEDTPPRTLESESDSPVNWTGLIVRVPV